ncbi:hypothetical protein GOC43_25630 [Sinorhizobium meliloti]|nr:hypothetical protein [Sinorhizobium meliloti]
MTILLSPSVDVIISVLALRGGGILLLSKFNAAVFTRRIVPGKGYPHPASGEPLLFVTAADGRRRAGWPRSAAGSPASNGYLIARRDGRQAKEALGDDWQGWWPDDDHGGGDDSPPPQQPLPEPA